VVATIQRVLAIVVKIIFLFIDVNVLVEFDFKDNLQNLSFSSLVGVSGQALKFQDYAI
jgi:hypothetical protein